MLTLSIKAITSAIESETPLDAVTEDGSIRIVINRYEPFVATAIHAGHHLRPALEDQCLLGPLERIYEEDPFTDEMILGQPIVLYGQDSRYEYDLNRPPEEAVYETAWGKKIWKDPLSAEERALSLSKHTNYYLILKALLDKLENKFGVCTLFDIHTYNSRRIERNTPLFNIGTENLDTGRFGKFIDIWQRELSNIQIDGIENQTLINDVFQGRGYQAVYIKKNHVNTLILPTEVKKVFQDEQTGEAYPMVLDKLIKQFKNAMVNTAAQIAGDLNDKVD